MLIHKLRIVSTHYSSSVQHIKHINKLGILKSISTNTTSKSNVPDSEHGENLYDVAIVGGGIIGAATAMTLANKHPTLRIALVEKESRLGTHQSGHNSGVVHAGIYYKPGSLKARLCVQGLTLSYAYFARNQIPYKKCGKLIVAVTPAEIPSLEALYARAQQNGVPSLKFLSGKEEIQKYEPHCEGLKAIWSPETGIVDWTQVTESYASNFVKSAGSVFLNFNVTQFQLNNGPNSATYPVSIYSADGKVLHSKYVLTCGGLHADRLATLSGCSPNPKIIPFRGEYLLLSPEKCGLIHGNIYPVPDARFPFLGVHFTPRMDGSLWLGPNAILAFKREGYVWTDFDAGDFMDAIRYKGFQKLATKYARFGLGEMTRSACPSLQLKYIQKYVPAIQAKDITRGPAGVRAQALDMNGNLVDDFVFDSGTGPIADRILHVRNCPSPGATSSLAIATQILDKIKAQFTLL